MPPPSQTHRGHFRYDALASMERFDTAVFLVHPSIFGGRKQGSTGKGSTHSHRTKVHLNRRTVQVMSGCACLT